MIEQISTCDFQNLHFSIFVAKHMNNKVFLSLNEFHSANLFSLSSVPQGLPVDIWLPPSGNHAKVNFDGSFNPITKTAGIGGIIRSYAWSLLLAYSGRVATEPSLEPELKALLEGIEPCKAMNNTHLQIEGDCLILVQSLQKSECLSWSFMTTWRCLIHTHTKLQW